MLKITKDAFNCDQLKATIGNTHETKMRKSVQHSLSQGDDFRPQDSLQPNAKLLRVLKSDPALNRCHT